MLFDVIGEARLAAQPCTDRGYYKYGCFNPREDEDDWPRGDRDFSVVLGT